MPHITIAGRQFAVESVYAAGHVLEANEANALNQVRFENLRNNFAEKAKNGATQEEFDEYAAGYVFGARGGGGGSRDPVEAEAMNIAREQIKEAIRKSGKSVSDYTAKAITAAAEQLLETQGDDIRGIAHKRIEEMQAVASQSLSDDVMAVLQSPDSLRADNTPSSEEETAVEEEAPSTSSRRRRA